MKSYKENMGAVWVAWHFYYMPRFLFQVWKNYLAFTLDFFSVSLLAATLFSPWRKYQWSWPKTFNITEYLNTFISNIFSRFIGALCRIVLIVFGSIAQAMVFIAGAVAIACWIALPFLCIGLLILFNIV